YGMKIAKSQEDVAKNNLSKAMITLLSNIENKYYSVLEAKALLAVAKNTQQRAEMQHDSAETKHLLGAISSSDFMQFQLEKSQSDVSLFSAEKQHKTALKDFNNYISSNNLIPEDISTELPLDEAKQIAEIEIAKIEMITTKLVELALGQNLELKNAEERKDTAKSYLRLSQTSFLPSVDFSVSKSWHNNVLTDGLKDSETYSLNFSVPIFPLVNKGLAYQTKKYEYKSSENVVSSTKNDLQLQTESYWLELVTSSKSLTASQISLNHATALFEQSTLEFQMGELSSSDYLASSISLYSTETQYYSAIYDYLRDKTNLNQLLCEVDYSVLNSIIFEGVN
ncbi:MAG: TolC family protein, partial [Candidatus Tenebribacter davisii]|nr:TolC family protein [Candidatus Tenebribacter davisii]